MFHRRIKNRLIVLFSVSIFCMYAHSALAASLSVLSLNLHGYHPTNEGSRWLEKADGKLTQADSMLFFFNLEELDRGHRLRLNQLAKDLTQMKPDIVFLQEVAAGHPSKQKNCSDFYQKPNSKNDDRFELNSALRLANRLPDTYQAFLACRGNVGWWTDATTFRDQRVLRSLDAQGSKREVVFDFNSNPYPSGLIIEGLAILVKAPLAVADEQHWVIPTAIPGDNGFVQASTILLNSRRADSPWIIAVNVHGARKLKHFEQAVQIRRNILAYLATIKLPGRFAGTIIGGDFNATLPPEPSTLPWQMDLTGRTDLRWPLEARKLGYLKSELLRFNKDEKIDPDANILDPVEAELRVDHAVENLLNFSAEWNPNHSGYSWGLKEALATAQVQGACNLPKTWNPACSIRNRIDLLLSNTDLPVLNAYVLYSNHDWKTLRSLSDHPGVWAEYRISNSVK